MNLDEKTTIREEILKSLCYQPVNINEADFANPLDALESFFLNHPIYECRSRIAQLFEDWLVLASEAPHGEEICDMLMFYKRLQDALNLCFVLIKSE